MGLNQITCYSLHAGLHCWNTSPSDLTYQTADMIGCNLLLVRSAQPSLTPLKINGQLLQLMLWNTWFNSLTL